MESTRRSMLCATGAAVGTALAGCTGGDETAEGRPADQQPVPRIAENQYPRPEVLNVDDEHLAADRYRFTAEINNAGSAGAVGIALVWLEEEGDDVYGPTSEVADVRETEFDAQQSQEVSFTTAFPEEYDAFGFRVWAETIQTVVRNAGENGSVRVRLLDGDEVINETELSMGPGETTTVDFDGNYSELDFGNVSVETDVP